MSAAEKLKALPVPFDLSEGHSTMLVLVDALPQIVAVVEAAEEYAEDGDRMYATEHERKTHAALSALDEALS